MDRLTDQTDQAGGYQATNRPTKPSDIHTLLELDDDDDGDGGYVRMVVIML